MCVKGRAWTKERPVSLQAHLADCRPGRFPSRGVRSPCARGHKASSFRSHGSFLHEGSWGLQRAPHQVPQLRKSQWNPALLLCLSLEVLHAC